MKQQARLWRVGAFLAAIAIIAGGWLLAIWPQLQQAERVHLEAQEAMTTNARHQQELDELKAEFRDIEALRTEFSEKRVRVPSRIDTTWLGVEIEALAKQTGVRLFSVTFDEPALFQPIRAITTPIDNMAVIPVRVQANGGFPSALRFLQAVQYQERLFAVHRIQWEIPRSSGITIWGHAFVLIDKDQPKIDTDLRVELQDIKASTAVLSAFKEAVRGQLTKVADAIEGYAAANSGSYSGAQSAPDVRDALVESQGVIRLSVDDTGASFQLTVLFLPLAMNNAVGWDSATGGFKGWDGNAFRP